MSFNQENATYNITHLNNLDVVKHGDRIHGLWLGGVLVTATAAQINAIADPLNKNVSVTAATATIDATYNNKNVLLNRAAGSTITLPAATGSGNTFNFIIGTAVTSNNYIVKVANSSDAMVGNALLSGTSNATLFFAASSGNDTITLNGTTTGGLAGARITVRDIATNVFQIEVISAASGTTATPFSSTV